MATIVGLTRRMVIAQTARVGCQNGNFRNVPFSCDSLMYEAIYYFPFCSVFTSIDLILSVLHFYHSVLVYQC